MVDKILYAKLKEKYSDEKVFVVPGTVNIKDGFNKSNKDTKVYDNVGFYVFRYDAEYNNSFTQIIPYVLIANKDKTRYYVSKRLSGDARLVNSYSLGFGGHINECDGYINIVQTCLDRELNEELDITGAYTQKMIGTVRDINSETSEHAGFVFLIQFENEDEVSIKETENLEGFWVDKQFLFDNYGKFESWSKLVIDHIYET